MRNSDIRIKDFSIYHCRVTARQPLKFGGVVMDYTTMALVILTAEDRQGNISQGYGAMSLAHMWSWPESALTPQEKDKATLDVLHCACRNALEIKAYLTPFQIADAIENICRNHFSATMPVLNILVGISALDAAVHDVFGRIRSTSSYALYGSAFQDDLASALGCRYKGKYIGSYLLPHCRPNLPNFHLVGGLDPLSPHEITEPLDDGMPECLEDWIRTEGVYCLKVKWRGDNLAWDFKRTADIYQLVRGSRGNQPVYLTGDTNEKCETPEYLVELLHKLREHNPELFASILYVEQPTSRNLHEHPHDFSALAKLKPVLLDESLTDLETFEYGLKLGASGAALKTCKGHSNALIIMSKCEEEKIPYSVQDLSLPGLAFIHSAGFAARINPVAGAIEGNGRQYFPTGSEYEKRCYPELFAVKGGKIAVSVLDGLPGLGFPLSPDKSPDYVKSYQPLTG